MKIVLALGGNALQSNPKDKTAEAQLKTCKDTAKSVVDLIEDGHTVVVVHGNGPQVGQILASLELAHQEDNKNPLMPFDVCGAFSQGYIGYHLQNAIKEELENRKILKDVGTVVTQVVVDESDQGFQNPTKPIGSFYNKDEAEKLEKEKGYVMKEDAGRGYRRVVASPQPIDIVEKDVIKKLVDDNVVVVSCGGGGIPVIRRGSTLKGIAAVIDKDLAAEKLAEVLDADALVILTAVDKICLNYNTENEIQLSKVSIEELNNYIDVGHFAPGSMLPKVNACKKFVETKEDGFAIISSLNSARQAINGEAGTKIVR